MRSFGRCLFVVAWLAIPGPASTQATAESPFQRAAVAVPSTTSRANYLRAIRRDSLADALRITLEFENETPFRDQRIDVPPRLVMDLGNAVPVGGLKNAALRFEDDVVSQIRVAAPASNQVRLSIDLQGAARHSVYALYNPFRLVIDIEREGNRAPAAPASASLPPSPNRLGGFSMSRQLGLGVVRVAIDPGHGGHDPGAKIEGLSEADLVLDVALRLEKLLRRQNVEVVVTRRKNVFVRLEERVAIANRAGADLFLSIHANASGSPSARGLETYFLNFASDSEAEAIAARENAGSMKAMHHLPDIVKAIATNNKVDESRDLAATIHQAMYARLRKASRSVKSLGVKQAPFMVLLGATMPSALIEVAFMTNEQEGALLRTESYRQQLAEGLLDGVALYRTSLKAPPRKVSSR